MKFCSIRPDNASPSYSPKPPANSTRVRRRRVALAAPARYRAFRPGSGRAPAHQATGDTDSSSARASRPPAHPLRAPPGPQTAVRCSARAQRPPARPTLPPKLRATTPALSVEAMSSHCASSTMQFSGSFLAASDTGSSRQADEEAIRARQRASEHGAERTALWPGQRDPGDRETVRTAVAAPHTRAASPTRIQSPSQSHTRRTRTRYSNYALSPIPTTLPQHQHPARTTPHTQQRSSNAAHSVRRPSSGRAVTQSNWPSVERKRHARTPPHGS